MSYSFSDDFVWGTATAAHQVEGGTWNNDWWAFEHKPGSGTLEPAGDACDHFWRYPSDIALLADLGFGAYRFSLEWSRIEPDEGEFSVAALDHYRRMCDTTIEHGLVPVVTYHHFTTPRWAVTDGGWTDPAIVDRFARFCERATAHLGDRIGMAATINEPNIVSLMGYMVGAFPPGHRDLGEYALANDYLKAAHRKGYAAIKAGPGDFPVGSTVAMGDWWRHRVPSRCSNRPAGCTRGNTSKRRPVTISSACRPTPAPGWTPTDSRPAPRRASRPSSWATSTGRTRWR